MKQAICNQLAGTNSQAVDRCQGAGQSALPPESDYVLAGARGWASDIQGRTVGLALTDSTKERGSEPSAPCRQCLLGGPGKKMNEALAIGKLYGLTSLEPEIITLLTRPHVSTEN